MLDFFKKILLALGLSAAFLFIIYFTARAKEEERNVQHFAMPYQVMEVFVDGKEGQIFVGMSEKIKLAEIAADLGAKPHPEDKFSALPEFPDFIGRRIYLYRTPIYIVYDQDRKTDYRSFAKTVGRPTIHSTSSTAPGAGSRSPTSTGSSRSPGRWTASAPGAEPRRASLKGW